MVGMCRLLEYLFQQCGCPSCRIRPELLLLLPQHREQAIKAFGHGIAAKVKRVAFAEWDGLLMGWLL